MKILAIFDLNLGLRMAHDTFLFKMCNALARSGHKVSFLVGSGDNIDDLWKYYGVPFNENMTVIRVPRVHRKRVPVIGLKISLTGVFNFACASAIKRIYRKEGIDAVYLSGIKPAELFLKLRGKVPVPYIYEVHQIYSEDYPKSDYADREREILKNAHRIITTTSALKKKLIGVYGLDENKIEVVHLATDIVENEGGLDHNRGLTPEKKTMDLCYFGQLYHLQGIEVAIESLRHIDAAVRLHIFGGTQKRTDELTSFAEQTGVAARVVFHGFTAPSELRRTVQELGPVLIMPSLSAGRMDYVAHSKIYEYLSYGLPIVASDLSSVREVLSEGDAAVLVEPNSTEALAAGIKQVLNDSAVAASLGMHARKLALKYSWEERERQLTCIFETTRLSGGLRS